MQGGLEIPSKMAVAMDIRTKWQQEVLDRYKELVYGLYFEPTDGEDVVGSFQKKDQDASFQGNVNLSLKTGALMMKVGWRI